MAPEVVPGGGAPPAPPTAPKPSKIGSWMRAHWVELASLSVAAVVGFFLIFRNHPAVQSALPTALTGGGSGGTSGSGGSPSVTADPPTPPAGAPNPYPTTGNAANPYFDPVSGAVWNARQGWHLGNQVWDSVRGWHLPDAVAAIQQFAGSGTLPQAPAGASAPSAGPGGILKPLGVSVDGHSPIASQLGTAAQMKPLNSMGKTAPTRPDPTPIASPALPLRPLGSRSGPTPSP